MHEEIDSYGTGIPKPGKESRNFYVVEIGHAVDRMRSPSVIVGFLYFGKKYPLNFELYPSFNASIENTHSQSVKISTIVAATWLSVNHLTRVPSKMGSNDLIEKSIAANSLQVELLEVSL